MRIFARLACIALLGIVAGGAACSSSNSGGADAGHPADGSTADTTSGSCGALAGCYSVDVTLSSTSPAACGSGTITTVADYTSIPAGGGSFTAGGCAGTLSGCSMTLDCPNGEMWKFTFTDQGFSATDTLTMQGGKCLANAVGTRLTACPVVDAGGAGDDGPTVLDATPDAIVAAEAGPDAGPESGAPDGGAEASQGLDGGVEAAVAESGAEAGAPESGADAASEAQASEAGADAASEAQASEAGADAASEAQAPEAGEDAQAEAAPNDGATGDDGGDSAAE